MNNFIKLNSPLFDHPDHFEFFKTLVFSDTPNFQRGFKIFEDSGYGEILKMKERESFIMEN